MTKNKGKNRWNNRGFKAAFASGEGLVRVNYNHRKGELSGNGVSPCGAAVTYEFSGKMNSRSARANVDIILDGEPFAESILDMKR